jgi:hypothetical protein
MIRSQIVLTSFLAVSIAACGLVPSDQDFEKYIRQGLVTDQGPENSASLPTYTSFPTYTPYPTYTPFAHESGGAPEIIDTQTSDSPVMSHVDGIIARNYLGKMESNGVKVELVRAIIGNSEALKAKFPDIAEDFDTEPFNKVNVLMELMFRITNNTDIILGFDTEAGGFSFINEEQINLDDYLLPYAIGNTDGRIFPGKFVKGGYWLPVSSLEDVSQARSIGLGLSPLYNQEDEAVTEAFLITAEVDPSTWGFEELPEEFK